MLKYIVIGLVVLFWIAVFSAVGFGWWYIMGAVPPSEYAGLIKAGITICLIPFCVSLMGLCTAASGLFIAFFFELFGK